eukprot:TRINITY_DN54635_c0_g1_i1.p1 TRINITY_DN54635_c0_g1~~TRINITY_DN54635_c0_g1_i1.p1  ORF type:complete len:389 (+),score=42.47 TRINITY_DN54635_c0_g1_i1:87-1253(+)
MENMEPIDVRPVSDASQQRAVADDGSIAVLPPPNLTSQKVRALGLTGTSNSQGALQLAFHIVCLFSCATAVGWCRVSGRWGILLMVQLPYGVVQSFLFNAFHEMVHNTAFRSRWLNTALAEILGFFIFRGATWFWCFHWTHHRFTNDPLKDPELSGGSSDLDDPTRSLSAYVSFLSGYPFGFERIPRMLRLALGTLSADPWVVDKSASVKRRVRIEAFLYIVGYCSLALFAILHPSSVGMPLILYWLLPHVMGSGHLRMYQFAEHRACQTGKYTDTNAWLCARTTTTWWLYRKLAWQMPFHIEHHAFPNVPFHHLEETHARVREDYGSAVASTRQKGIDTPSPATAVSLVPSGCNPRGEDGYSSLHAAAFRRMVGNAWAARSVAAKAA